MIPQQHLDPRHIEIMNELDYERIMLKTSMEKEVIAVKKAEDEIKIGKVLNLKWLLESNNVVDGGLGGGQDQKREQVFDEIECGIIKGKIIELIKTY